MVTVNLEKVSGILSFLFVMGFLLACSPLSKTKKMNPVFILKKTACYGTCPVYELKIYNNRIATLHAEEFLDIQGAYFTKIDKEIYNALIEDFSKSAFFDFKNEYIHNISDLPTTYITFREKTIKDYYGSPEQLKELERTLASLVDELKWKKSD